MEADAEQAVDQRIKNLKLALQSMQKDNEILTN